MLEKHARLLLSIPVDPDWGQNPEYDSGEETDKGMLKLNYSGRGMYGAMTCGIVIPRNANLCTLLGEALERLMIEIDDTVDTTDSAELQSLFSELVRASKNWKTDDMGRDSMIVY